MRLYFFDKEGNFIKEKDARKNPRNNSFLIPKHTTRIKPLDPEFSAFNIIENKWILNYFDKVKSILKKIGCESELACLFFSNNEENKQDIIKLISEDKKGKAKEYYKAIELKFNHCKDIVECKVRMLYLNKIRIGYELRKGASIYQFSLTEENLVYYNALKNSIDNGNLTEFTIYPSNAISPLTYKDSQWTNARQELNKICSKILGYSINLKFKFEKAKNKIKNHNFSESEMLINEAFWNSL